MLVYAALQWRKSVGLPTVNTDSLGQPDILNFTQLFFYKNRIIQSNSAFSTGWEPTDLLQQVDTIPWQRWHLGKIQPFVRGQTASLLYESRSMNVNRPRIGMKWAPVLLHLLWDLSIVLQICLVADQPSDSRSWAEHFLQLLETKLGSVERFLFCFKKQMKVSMHSWEQYR